MHTGKEDADSSYVYCTECMNIALDRVREWADNCAIKKGEGLAWFSLNLIFDAK